MIRNKKGYSVLEIVLVLGIVSGIAYTAFSFYRNEKHDAAVRETVQQVRTIFNTADAYLMSAKPNGSVQEIYPISMQILKNTLAFPLNLGELREGSEAEVAASTTISTSASKSASTSVSLSTSASVSSSISASTSLSTSISISQGAATNKITVSAEDVRFYHISMMFYGTIDSSDHLLDAAYPEINGDFGMNAAYKPILSSGISYGYTTNFRTVIWGKYDIDKGSKVGTTIDRGASYYFPYFRSSSEKDDVILIKLLYINAVAMSSSKYNDVNHTSEIISIMMDAITKNGMIDWYGANVSADRILSSFKYIN